MLSAAVMILGKDLRLRLRDRSVWLFALVVPLGLTFLFSSIFPETEAIGLRAGVVDLDGGQAAAGFVDGVLPTLIDEGIVTEVQLGDLEDARERVRAGDVGAVWIFPAGFSDAVVSESDARIEVLVSAGQAVPGELARQVADAYARRIEQIGLALAVHGEVTGGPVDPVLMEAVANAAGRQEALITIADQAAVGGEPLDAVSYLAAGMAAFFVFFVVQFGITGLLEERSLGTLPRLLAAPIPPGAIQLGKLLVAFVLGLASMTVLALASSWLLGARWGPAAGVAILIVALVVAALGVMSLVAVFARTAEQAGNYQSIVAIVLGMSGGVFFPLPDDSGPLRLLTTSSPHGWFLRGMNELSTSGSWSVALPAAGAILLFALAAALPAVMIQRRRSAW